MLESLRGILPAKLGECIGNLSERTIHHLEEIRVRQNRPLEIVASGSFRFVTTSGREQSHPGGAYSPSKEDCLKLLDKLSNHSLYTLEEELRRGYITVRGGHRVGIAGRAVLDGGSIRHIRDITGFNIRIAREVHGVCEAVLPTLLDIATSSIHHTLVISPPGQGKTTLLRDIARHLSYGQLLGVIPWGGVKVAIVDERSELAACIDGVPSFDVGPRTDVLDGCPKAEGMTMMIRSMSPDVIVVDEIGRPEDADGIHEAVMSGARVIASAHGRDYVDIADKPVLGPLIRSKRFSRFVLLDGRSRGAARIDVLDGEGRRIATREHPHVGTRSVC